VEAQVDRAVARQVQPLLEAYDQAEARVRFNDVMGGIGMIVGLAGAGLWALSRRRRDAPQ
jgi:nickel transport protein